MSDTPAPETTPATTTTTTTPTEEPKVEKEEPKVEKEEPKEKKEEEEEETVIKENVDTDEETLFGIRCKVFFFRLGQHDETKSWRERGVGEVKFLKNRDTGKIRLLMRRDKTMKICLNHYISPALKLEVNVGSDRSWVYTCPAEFSDEELKEEVIAIRFANSENAQKFKEQFEAAQAEVAKLLN